MSKSDLVAEVEQLLSVQSTVEIKETSKSWVFLTEDRVYKLKKQIRDELQDLTPLRARHDNALSEVDLNRRLAPDTYTGVVRLGRQARDGLVIDDPEAETIDWLVEMRRLPQDQMLDVLIADGASRQELSKGILRLVPILTGFYQTAPATRLTASELMTVMESQISLARDVLLNPAFAQYHGVATEVIGKIEALWPDIDVEFQKRVDAGAFVEGHGDLRPEHICLTKSPVIYDCLEFNRTLRLVDPYSELSFFGLECTVFGADWIGPFLMNALEPDLGPRPGGFLMAVYEAYHAVMRARLCLAHLLQEHPRTPKKWPPLGTSYLEIAKRRLDQACINSRSRDARAGMPETM